MVRPRAVTAKGFERERVERGLLLDKDRGHLTLRGAMDTRIGPSRVPAIEIGLRFVDRVKAHALQRRLLGVADLGFGFALPIGIADTTRQRDHTVPGEHIATAASAHGR